MADPQTSPISQLLNSLGLTREDLHKRSDQMRQFLTADSSNASRVSDHGRASSLSSTTDLCSGSVSSISVATSARSLSRAGSSSFQDASPPATPVKSEPTDAMLPLRQVDTMEAVIERQRLARKEKRGRKEKERDLVSRGPMPHQESPTPSRASPSAMSLDSMLCARDDAVGSRGTPSSTCDEDRVSPPPLTPQQSKYYREHTVSVSQSRRVSVSSVTKTEDTTPTRPPSAASQQLPPPHYYPYPQYALPQYLPLPLQKRASTSTLPVTPQTKRTFTPPPRQRERSPLPASSPPPESSPMSSPVRGIVNMVSSPGPMGPAPEEEEYETLPYTLPPGPYSPNKPDLSYAALLGRAILSSPEHRLTLQEIYDWITIVYPYFKRGETTWMNSIRHVLSTTVCFRKVTRDRALGRTLWAIWDEDIECFKNGGFRKQLCKDMKVPEAKNKRGRKQLDTGDDSQGGRKSKKAKKDQSTSVAAAAAAPSKAAVNPQFILPATSHPLFPPSRPTPHHQPYYANCMPSDLVFPPLPIESTYRHGIAQPVSSAASQAADDDERSGSSPPHMSRSSSIQDASAHPPPPSSASSSSLQSMPNLTPNRSSSSSPPPSTSDMDLDVNNALHGHINDRRPFTFKPSVAISGVDRSDDENEEGEQDDMFAGSKLTPVQFWGKSPKGRRVRDGLQPGFRMAFDMPDELASDASDDQDEPLISAAKKQKQRHESPPFPSLPPSPTPARRSARVAKATAGRGAGGAHTSNRAPRLSVPRRLNTPPLRNNRAGKSLQLSPVYTPLSHHGLHMSPTASLAHYKSNLNPPPPVGGSMASSSAADNDDTDGNDPMRTPSRKRTAGSAFGGGYFTPGKKLVFPTSGDSPFRTPGGVGSPFRNGGIFDPHDPMTLLDEELRTMNAGGTGDSPTGLFGKSRSSLLYDSPNNGFGSDSPGKWLRWW